MISIIIPIYNGEKWIETCVCSLLEQSLTPYEILLVNDGSTDGSEALCQDLAKRHNCIKYLSKPNGGAASARNLGIDNAKGDYIAFVDADDTVAKNYLEALYKAATENDADIVMCDYIKHTKNNTFPFSQPIRSGLYSKEQIEKELFPCLIMFDNLEFPPTISNCVCMFKRGLLEEHHIRYPDVRLCEDSYFGSVALYNAKRFVYLKGQHLYNYLYYPTSVSHSNDQQKTTSRWTSFIKLNEEYEAYFKNSKFDFSMQIRHNMLYFVLNQLAYINGHALSLAKQRAAIKEICKNDRVTRSFKGMDYPKVPFKLKLCIFFIKHKMALLYCLLHR